ncbi:hypothetical protein [Thiobacillus denitrificans]|uniref:ATP-dependent DNA ligase n=1 Tax=Thiobacillus denitrificans TaxID=36861 RepID=UPI0007534B99|nr:hypothetical protein [Thiobacillus denitrificans]
MTWQTYPGGDLAGWLVSEKLDGVRACWDGAQLATQTGNAIHAPAWLTAGLPAMALEGELYAGAGTLPRVQGLARRARSDGADWSGVGLYLFDAPGVPGGFAERFAVLQRLAGILPAHIGIIEHHPCPGRAWLAARFAAVVAAGGEGLVARHPSGEYRASERSQQVLKIKQHPDTPFLIGYSGEDFYGGLPTSGDRFSNCVA